ncbi:MAG TPA: hypothetical protein VK974_03515 [Methylophilaceae bacterium]|nr:hypothetical protein [Methylophilaceae bacterium]
MKNTIIFSALFLSACVTATPTYAPDGSKAHSIDCSDEFLTWGSCYEKAGEICKEKGYTVVAGGTDSKSTVSGNQYGVVGSTTQTRSLVIKCNP